ncbi:14993_t:CDS:2 [Cetraspora pellucida]|uniref:14993_t:CDS:1 n=1 Tax=Cetraspora pellucida TaxID=1433469 RepID=A0A9N9EXU9_9GLOM|nr:14993_t:CDS:2 [Cetraspora pellucida]
MENSPLLPIRESDTNISGRKFYNTLVLGILCACIASFVIQTEYMTEFIEIGSELVSRVRSIRQVDYIDTENEEGSDVQDMLVFLLGESINIGKVCSVFLSIAGVIIMTMNQKDQTPKHDIGGHSEVGDNGIIFTGDLVALFGAVTYGLYEVLYKKYGSPPTPSILFSNTITGLIGIFTLIFLWVPIPILHYMEIEEFCLPDMKTFGYILFMALFGVVFNACFMVVIALTSPIFAAIGIMLTIPIVAFVDALVINSPLNASTIVGGLCILISFVLLSWKSIRDVAEKRRSE